MFFGKAVVNWVVDEREGRELERGRERMYYCYWVVVCLFWCLAVCEGEEVVVGRWSVEG